jgi:hypothetical protein
MKFFLKSILIPSIILVSQCVSATAYMIEPKIQSSSYQCPQREVLENFLSFDDLMLGEHHGTVETPAFLKCLVDYSIKFKKERIIISLEMPSSAREPRSNFWRKDDTEDGRSSIAMYNLVRHLVDLENKLLIDLHFQHRSRYFETGEAFQKFRNQREKSIGVEIRELSSKGKIVVLAGNVHTMRTLPESMKVELDFEGKYVGPSFTHVIIESANGGFTWSCQPNCGIQPHFKQKNISPGAFVQDATRGHDFIYYLDIDGFTASEPNQ